MFCGALEFPHYGGYVFGFPVSELLVRFGVKEGMENPAEMSQSQQTYRTQVSD
jgi:hypothetical protein